MNLNNIYKLSFLALAVSMVGCKTSGDNQGLEFAPNMYHSVAYEPLKQIMDEESGLWVNSQVESIGEYYSANPNNPHSMNMREPVANTVRRGDFLPYRIPKDSFALAARVLINPLDSTTVVLAEGKRLYGIFCTHCHGANGTKPGLVGEKYAGVPSYTSAAVKNLNEGHIFHVITLGKGRMYPHGSQLSIKERWEVVRYVQTLQRQ